MKKAVIGILAHVDAGKTTLAEAILYKTGKVRKIGRVDHGDTLLDTHELEKARGITIFAGQATFQQNDWKITLIDTPGHVDFSAETERMLRVLDYALLVISATDGVQAHTKTLWNLLQQYQIPTMIFVTKMDFARLEKETILLQLQTQLSDHCVDFTQDKHIIDENLAICDDTAMEQFLEQENVSLDLLQNMILQRKTFPCFFGSGITLEGIDAFLGKMEHLMQEKWGSDLFGAKVFKITHDEKQVKLTHLKITGGKLRVRDSIAYGGYEEKVSEIRIYSGEKYVNTDEVSSGDLCAVVGMTHAVSGMGLGAEEALSEPILEPVMQYQLRLPDAVSPKTFLPKLRILEEEDPLLRVSWDSRSQTIGVCLMGEIQIEILKSLILQRYGVQVDIIDGRVQYKETIEDKIEGIGHYEPLRHYAEVHLILTPLERGKGILLNSQCSEDILDKNWQRLIMTHLAEKQHLGVLIGAPMTDVEITIATGKAHVKHTEGGDFRQATYRAVRQGLMKAKSILLEPYYQFRIEVPKEKIGRVLADIKIRNGQFSAPQEENGISILVGKAPVATLNTYAAELAAYTSGKGRIQLNVCGYEPCHNAQEVITAYGYQPENDVENTPDSIFCSHGKGFEVKWHEVEEYMHLDACLKK